MIDSNLTGAGWLLLLLTVAITFSILLLLRFWLDVSGRTLVIVSIALGAGMFSLGAAALGRLGRSATK